MVSKTDFIEEYTRQTRRGDEVLGGAKQAFRSDPPGV